MIETTLHIFYGFELTGEILTKIRKLTECNLTGSKGDKYTDNIADHLNGRLISHFAGLYWLITLGDNTRYFVTVGKPQRIEISKGETGGGKINTQCSDYFENVKSFCEKYELIDCKVELQYLFDSY
jgi:hypothetical protein